MSESTATRPNPHSIRGLSSDDHALAQVEKWMAMIREFGPPPRNTSTDSGKTPPAVDGGELLLPKP